MLCKASVRNLPPHIANIHVQEVVVMSMIEPWCKAIEQADAQLFDSTGSDWLAGHDFDWFD